MDIEFIKSQLEAEDVWSYKFKKPGGLQFDAGDYVELSLEYGPKNIGGRRWLTIASSPHESELQFTTVVNELSSDYKQALSSLKPGDNASISPPIGTFNLPRNQDQSILWIAGGIGVTPFRSMARHLLNKNEKRPISTLYVAKPGKFVFQTELRNVSDQYETTNLRPDFNTISSLFPDWKKSEIYLSGPQNFCEELYQTLIVNGASKPMLHLDYFPGYSQI